MYTNSNSYFSKDFLLYSSSWNWVNLSVKFIKWCFHQFHADPHIALEWISNLLHNLESCTVSQTFYTEKCCDVFLILYPNNYITITYSWKQSKGEKIGWGLSGIVCPTITITVTITIHNLCTNSQNFIAPLFLHTPSSPLSHSQSQPPCVGRLKINVISSATK